MAGRGRGRGGKSLTFNVESLGFGRGGDTMPTAIMQPPPKFPPIDCQPIPLDENDKIDYLLELKREFRFNMEDSPYFMKIDDKKKDIIRYSDKYISSNAAEKLDIDWSQLPLKLRPSSVKMKQKSNNKSKDSAVLIGRIEDLEKKEKNSKESGEESEEDEKSEAASEDNASDDDELEDNDYCEEYFDNGEGFLDEEDDKLDDEPLY